jgi:hypothetical protein
MESTVQLSNTQNQEKGTNQSSILPIIMITGPTQHVFFDKIRVGLRDEKQNRISDEQHG